MVKALDKLNSRFRCGRPSTTAHDALPTARGRARSEELIRRGPLAPMSSAASAMEWATTSSERTATSTLGPGSCGCGAARTSTCGANPEASPISTCPRAAAGRRGGSVMRRRSRLATAYQLMYRLDSTSHNTLRHPIDTTLAIASSPGGAGARAPKDRCRRLACARPRSTADLALSSSMQKHAGALDDIVDVHVQASRQGRAVATALTSSPRAKLAPSRDAQAPPRIDQHRTAHVDQVVQSAGCLR